MESRVVSWPTVYEVIVTGAEPFTLENPLESGTKEEFTSATWTPSVIGVDEADPDELDELEDPDELENNN